MAKLLSKLLIGLMVVSVAAGMTACKSQKKLAKEKAAAEYTANVDKAKKDLLDILNENTSMSLSEKESRVAEIRNMNLNDPEVNDLLDQAEEKLAKERSEYNQKQMEEKQKNQEANKTTVMTGIAVDDYFTKITAAKSVSEANLLITQALAMFSSPEAPVLIIIAKSGSTVDYDRPTTIKNYLNYLKDTKNNINKVDKITYDVNGKIKELELIKIK